MGPADFMVTGPIGPLVHLPLLPIAEAGVVS
jgi:hypothetical protein